MTVEWVSTDDGLVPRMDGETVVWYPQAPSQTKFLECPPTIFEVLLEGNRGSGKTDALIMDFVQHVGQGFGAEWRGILFRQTFPQLSDIITKTKKWFPRLRNPPTFNESKVIWTWPTGETLRLSYMETEDDYWNYHGGAWPWIGWEELTTWPTDHCYRVMMSCSRSTRSGMPRKYRATTNSYGPGHNWCKSRFQLPIPPGQVIGPVIREQTTKGGVLSRVAVRAMMIDNKVLLTAEPDYIEKIKAAARNPAELHAWVEDDWNIVAGGMFDDLWRPEFHQIPNLAFREIPKGWRIDRSYDHGQSKPFSVGWWAESNGEPILIGQRTFGAVRGDLIRVVEWYGCGERPNEGIRMLSTQIAEGIRERQRDWGVDARVRPGPADTSIFDDYEPGKSVAGDMLKKGVRWTRADKRPGSRKQGWEQLRKFLKGAVPSPKGIRETPGIFICDRCDNFIRTIPVLPRGKTDIDDVDTRAEDHIADEVRYRLRAKMSEAQSWGW